MENEYKVVYDHNKAEVLDYLEKTMQLLHTQGNETEEKSLGKLKENVEEGLFSIVLVGEFSAGKSTFLNALMRKKVLPSFTNETTATVNFLRHSSQAPEGVQGVVYYRDGSVQQLFELSEKTIENVVSTRGDKNGKTVAATVDHVDLFLESDFLQDGVMLVDSPGLNGMKGNHREITERQIRESHACIFMFRAEQPGTKTDFEFLRQLKSQSSNIFFVMNKIDAIRSDEGQTVEDVIQELCNTYKEQFPEEKSIPKIWPLAAYAALVARDATVKTYLGDELVTTQERRNQLEEFSRMKIFEERLWKYLTQGERARAQLCGPVETAMRTLSKERDDLKNKIKLLEKETGGEELQKQKTVLEEELAKKTIERKTTTPELRQKVQSATRDLMENAGRQIRCIYDQIEQKLNDSETPAELQDLSEELSDDLNRRFCKMGATLDEDLKGRLLEIINEEYEEYFSELEDKLADCDHEKRLEFHITDVAITDISIGIDLEQFNVECEKLQSQIDMLEEERSQTELSAIRARKIERNIDELKSEIKDLKQSRRYVQENFVLPDITYYSKEVETYHKRHGILGMLGNVLFGEKRDTSTETVQDDSAQKDAKQRQKIKLQAIDEEMERRERELLECGNPDRSSEELDFMQRRALEKMERLEAALKQLQEAHSAEMEQKSHITVKKLRRRILEALDEVTSAVSEDVRRYIRNQERQYVAVVRDVLNARVNQEIELVQKKLDDLTQAIRTTGEERDQQLKQAQEKSGQIKALLERGAELCGELENTMKDQIEQEAL